MPNDSTPVSLVRRVRSHRTKVTILVLGIVAVAHGLLTDNDPLLVVGVMLGLFAGAQLHQYWGTHEYD